MSRSSPRARLEKYLSDFFIFAPPPLLAALEILRANQTLWEFFKYGSWISLQFFIFRVPMVLLMVERMGVHYIWADYVAGIILAVTGFFVSKYWIWR